MLYCSSYYFLITKITIMRFTKFLALMLCFAFAFTSTAVTATVFEGEGLTAASDHQTTTQLSGVFTYMVTATQETATPAVVLTIPKLPRAVHATPRRDRRKAVFNLVYPNWEEPYRPNRWQYLKILE